jgi:hypothetical protein
VLYPQLFATEAPPRVAGVPEPKVGTVAPGA